MATLAAVAKTTIVCAVTKDTNVLTATVVSATGIHCCRTKQENYFIRLVVFYLNGLFISYFNGASYGFQHKCSVSCVLTKRLENGVRDHNMTRLICSTIQQLCVAATEAVCFHHSPFCPVSEKHVVFKHCDSERMR